jgi:sialate O-acetylesterase
MQNDSTYRRPITSNNTGSGFTMTSTVRTLLLSVCLAPTLTTSVFAAPPQPVSLFSDHMVLQRDAEIPVWGTADAGAQVSVSFAGQTVATTASDEGIWKVSLKPLKASADPRSMKVSSGEKTVAIKDVLVGDVWIGSGQSNMAGRAASYAKNDETLAALVTQGSFPTIRLMNGGPKPVWTETTSETIPRASALLFPFGERLQRELDVPIGLILGAVGGTPSGYWIPPETFASSEKCKTSIAEFSKTFDPAKNRKQYEARLKAWEKAAAKAKAEGKKPRGRKPAPTAGPGGSLRGGRIGGLFDRYIRSVAGYRIKGVLWDQGEARSGVQGVDQYVMMSELIHGWRELWGQGDFPFLFVQKPSGGGSAFSNKNPITRNGESFSAIPKAANLAAMSGGQRFLYVRLMRDNPNAFMVPASDLGPNIHPSNKWGYGNRAAEVALSEVYKTGLQAYGPMYRSHKVDGQKIVISFDQVGKGLTVAHSDTLQGFTVAGKDGVWHWADAKIDGETIIVWSDKVSSPTQVRYAFAARFFTKCSGWFLVAA